MASADELFAGKKRTILEALSVPNEAYSDLSPKGSVDEGIRSLIDLINSLDGVVTTSSCAGRISVYQEGVKDQLENVDGQRAAKSIPGGKGNGGKWLFVSHDPILKNDEHLMDKFQLRARDNDLNNLLELDSLTPSDRFVRLQFEPMILHIMTSSLQHAQMVLSAAMSAGLRESGVQSLKSLSSPNSFPMIAVRTTGIALSSIIGYLDKTSDTVVSLVDERYLKALVMLADSRFVTNSQRIDRFTEALRSQFLSESMTREPKSIRAARKRMEGLQKQKASNSTLIDNDSSRSVTSDVNDTIDDTFTLFE